MLPLFLPLSFSIYVMFQTSVHVLVEISKMHFFFSLKDQLVFRMNQESKIILWLKWSAEVICRCLQFVNVKKLILPLSGFSQHHKVLGELVTNMVLEFR